MATPATRKSPAEDPAETGMPAVAPVVVELGRQRAKRVKQLRKGRGKLVDRVTDVIAELRRAGTLAAGAVPVVLVIRQKPKVERTLFGSRKR